MRQEIVHRGRQAMRDGLTPTDVARATRSRGEQRPERLSRHPNHGESLQTHEEVASHM